MAIKGGLLLDKIVTFAAIIKIAAAENKMPFSRRDFSSFRHYRHSSFRWGEVFSKKFNIK
jgi:hypothetical protein